MDVVSEVEMECPRERVASFSGDPANAPKWYVNIKSVEWKGEPGVRVGARIAFVAVFLGKRLAYTYEIVEHVPGDRLVMRTAEGPFPMETSYAWADAGPGRTKMTLRNRGEPKGFSKILASMMAFSMRKANRKDLARLKEVMESRAPP